VRCGGCGIPAAASGRVWHWPSRPAAVSELSGPAWGWSATSDLQVCRGCLARRRCAQVGHDWDGWQAAEGIEEEDLSVRVCGRCGDDELVPTDCLAPRVLCGLGGAR
jgi:hypothetical protein